MNSFRTDRLLSILATAWWLLAGYGFSQDAIPEIPLDGPIPDSNPPARWPVVQPAEEDEAPTPGAINPRKFKRSDLPPLDLPSDGELPPPLPDIPGMVVLPDHPDTQYTPRDPATRKRLALWEWNPRTARKQAMKEGRHMLLAFVGASWSRPSQLLNSEVFTQKEFHEFAAEHLQLSYIDFDSNENDQSNAHKHFKKHFEVKGFPAVVLFDPEGEVLKKITGYRKGMSASHFSKIKQAVLGDLKERAAEEERRLKLVEEGYRDWTSRAGSTLFAKFVAANHEAALLLEESGRRRKVLLKQLSLFDRELIRRQKGSK